MIPTIAYIEEAFDKYNKLCFQGTLTPPRFKLSRSRSQLGWMKFKWRRRLFKTVKYDFTIALSTCYDLTEDEADDVLIHEMIHYYIASKNMEDDAPHGALFHRFMNQINERYGRHITVSSRRRHVAAVQPKDEKGTTWLVLALEMTDGKRYLSTVSTSAAGRLNGQLDSIPHLHRHAWYMSSNHFFGTLPRVRSLRAVRVTEEEYETYLNGATMIREKILR